MHPAHSPSLLDRALRLGATAIHKLLNRRWSRRRPRTYGAHALALTPERRLILVRLRYARGWRLPGGGRAPDEDPRAAVLRELREEIGMTAHGAVRLACEFEEMRDFRRDLASVLVVEDVCYRPARWSWEVEEVVEASLSDLPRDLSPLTRRWVDMVRPNL